MMYLQVVRISILYFRRYLSRFTKM